MDAARLGMAFLLFVFATFCAALAAMTLRVMIDLIKAGPRAAQEAYEEGDSLKAWWTGKHPNPTRTSIVGRKDKTHGVVMEEAGSRDTNW